MSDHVQSDGDTTTEESGPVGAGLRVEAVRVRGFRALKDFCLELDPMLTILIGENNTGKTSLLEALETVLGLRRGTEDDLHMDKDGAREPAFLLDLALLPEQEQGFDDDLRVVLANAIQRRADGQEFAAIRFTGEPAADRSGLSIKRVFIRNWSGCGDDPSAAQELPQPV